MAEGARHAGLDRLKAGLTLLVVFHHTAITYGGAGGWFYRERPMGGSLSSTLLTFFCAVNQAYFMGLFFLIAGYFTPRALEAKGAAHFLRDRLVRLGIPSLVFGWTLGPATIALVQSTLQGRRFGEVMGSLWQRHVFEQGPLWFAKALLLLALVTVTLHALMRWPRKGQRPFPSNRTLLLAALGCAAASFGVRLAWPVGSEWWGLQLGYFPGYLILYGAGCLAAQNGWLQPLPMTACAAGAASRGGRCRCSHRSACCRARCPCCRPAPMAASTCRRWCTRSGSPSSRGA